jgi:integral membrane protein
MQKESQVTINENFPNTRVNKYLFRYILNSLAFYIFAQLFKIIEIIYIGKIIMHLLYTHLGRLRIIGFLEGISFLLLMGIGVPLKYFAGYEHATQELGMAHGVLFIAYIIAVIPVFFHLKWSIKTTFLVYLASLLPFGTFIADHRIFKPAMMQKVKV